MKMEQIQRMAEKMREKGIVELEIQREGVRIKMRRASCTSAQRMQEPQRDEGMVLEFTSPMVGTFHRVVAEGEKVDVGQTLCKIEALKVFNEIKSNVSGTVERILINDGHPVEYGQPLFLIRADVSQDSYSK